MIRNRGRGDEGEVRDGMGSLNGECEKGSGIGPSGGSGEDGGSTGSSSLFECNVCFDTADEPVVTQCGHLYCWPCLARWMAMHAEAPLCPVCKSAVERDRVFPIYGRGREQRDPRKAEESKAKGRIPPRPSGVRTEPSTVHPMPNPFGMYGASPFGRMAGNTPHASYGSFSFTTFGLFPSLFGMQFSYPAANPPGARDHPITPEQETQEFMSRMLIMVALFIIFCLLFF
mmetsp:Transcript_5303/g.10879  ORF Transcript_5303/g.10879 Transcript_5303/m.10879 type:complete len:229 (+) Transcript_5303:34-720(+)